MTRILLLLLLLVCVMPSLASDPPARITVEAQIWTLPAELALPMIPRLRDPESNSAAIQSLRQFRTEGRASLLAQPRFISGGSRHGSAETMVEQREPCEWDPFTERGMIHRPVAGVRNTYRYGSTVLPPSAIGSRNVGVTLEGAAVVSHDGQAIDLSVAISQTILDGWKSLPGGSTLGEAVAFRPVPQYRVLNTKPANVRLRSGAWILTGSFMPSQPGQPFVLHLLRATIHPVTDP